MVVEANLTLFYLAAKGICAHPFPFGCQQGGGWSPPLSSFAKIFRTNRLRHVTAYIGSLPGHSRVVKRFVLTRETHNKKRWFPEITPFVPPRLSFGCLVPSLLQLIYGIPVDTPRAFITVFDWLRGHCPKLVETSVIVGGRCHSSNLQKVDKFVLSVSLSKCPRVFLSERFVPLVTVTEILSFDSVLQCLWLGWTVH